MEKISMKPHCVYCGEEEENWDDYHKYYECNCEDALLKRKLMKKLSTFIDEINKKLPSVKFEILTSPNEPVRYIRVLEKPIPDSF